VSGARVVALAGRIIRGLRHDPRSVALIIVVPLIVMALIGYLMGTNREPLRVGLVTPELASGGGASFGARFDVALRRQPGVEVVLVTSEASGRGRVADGDLAGLVVVGPAGQGPVAAPVEVVVAGEDVRVEEPVVRAAAVAAAAATGKPFPADGMPDITVSRISLPTGARPTTITYAAPAMITVFAFLFVFMLTSVAFLRERSSGTLDRLLASPVTKADMLTGYLFGFIGFAVTQTMLVLGYATLVLHAQVAGPLWLVFLILALLVVGVVNLGITLSFYARNELQVIQFIPLVLLPQVFLGGLFWPVQTLWRPLRLLSELFPVTHAVAALRAVMIAGQGFRDVLGQLLALAAFTAAMVLAGVAVLRRQRA
jgi:ABC-2 type transport system permease protein